MIQNELFISLRKLGQPQANILGARLIQHIALARVHLTVLMRKTFLCPHCAHIFQIPVWFIIKDSLRLSQKILNNLVHLSDFTKQQAKTNLISCQTRTYTYTCEQFLFLLAFNRFIPYRFLSGKFSLGIFFFGIICFLQILFFQILFSCQSP